jgi:hypothetical protein
MRIAAAFGALLLSIMAPGSEAPAGAGQAEPSEEALERQRLARDRSEARARIRIRTDDANRWAVGSDVRGPLAEMLVPNVRPVPILRNRDGVPLEVDLAAGVETPADWVSGTRFEGLSAAALAPLASWRGETFGPACNAEVRTRFAAHIGRRLSGFDQLKEAYRFLAARTPYWRGYPAALQPTGQWREELPMVSRLVAFDGDTRRPPVRWSADFESIEADLVRWTRRSRTGRLLQQAMDEFWRENGPLLGDDARICPEATARRSAIQARIVAALEARASGGGSD